MTINQVLKSAKSKLIGTNSKLDAEVLLAFVLQKDRSWLVSHKDDALTDYEIDIYQQLITHRSKLEPIAYLLGSQPFYGRDFFVNHHVLIPRPESELIIDIIKDEIKADQIIVDVGTGSGCLAITSALELPSSLVIALDIDRAALKVAKTNAKTHQVTNIRFYQSDLLQHMIDNNQSCDIILANLPYLTQDDIDESPTSQELLFEPQQALLSDDDEFKHIKMCTKQAFQVLNPNGKICLEMLPSQIVTFLEWKNHELPQFQETIYQDLSNRDRTVVLTKTP